MNKKQFILGLMLSISALTFGQVGIGTIYPKSNLDVTGKPADATVVDGITVPRLSGNQLKDKDAVYGTDQTGTIIYVTAAASPTSTKTAEVTSPGFYYFDGTVWKAKTGVTATEPWLVQNSTTEATSNSENIYQTGKVAIGGNFDSSISTKQLEVKGDFKSEIVLGGNLTGLEVNSPLLPEGTGMYWTNPSTDQFHTFHATSNGVNASALDNLTMPTKISSFNANLNSINVYSKHNGDAKQGTLELNGNEGRFALYSNDYSTNIGSMIKSDGANGLLLYNAGSNVTENVTSNDRTQITLKKGEGVNFSNYNSTGDLIANYKFPKSNGSNGQVLTSNGSGQINWSTPTDINIYNNNGTITAGENRNVFVPDATNLNFNGQGGANIFTFTDFGEIGSIAYEDFGRISLATEGNNGDISITTKGTTGSNVLLQATSGTRNVGIGTQTPSAKLHTNGTLRHQGLTTDNTQTDFLTVDSNGNVEKRLSSTFLPSILYGANATDIITTGVTASSVSGDSTTPSLFETSFTIDRTSLVTFNYNISFGTILRGDTGGALDDGKTKSIGSILSFVSVPASSGYTTGQILTNDINSYISSSTGDVNGIFYSNNSKSLVLTPGTYSIRLSGYLFANSTDTQGIRATFGNGTIDRLDVIAVPIQ